MTLVRNVESGFGLWGMRLVVEGLPYEFVTDTTMQGAGSDDRTRYVGLVGDSIEISEHVDIARAKLEVGGMSVRIVDVNERATLAFAKRPTYEKWLAADLAAGASTVVLKDTTGLSANDKIYVDGECIKIGTVASSTNLTGCTRAYRQTFDQAHYTIDGEHLRMPVVTDLSLTIEGRRVFLYFYGQGDLPTGDGTLRWIGRCATGARISEDMTSWEFSVDPVTAVLNQDLGSDLADPVSVRGIYYPWDSPIRIEISELTGADWNDDVSVSQTIQLPTSGAGFFETQQAFCDALNAQIAVGGSWKAVLIQAEPVDDTSWRIVYQTAGAGNERYLRVRIHSAVDGVTFGRFASGVVSSSGDEVSTIAAATTYYTNVRGAVPRGCFGPSNSPSFFVDPSLADTWPNNRVYFGGGADPTGISAISGTWPGDAGQFLHRIYSVDATTRSAMIFKIPIYERSTYVYVRYDAMDLGLPNFKVARSYGTGTLYDFLNELVTESPDFANLGGVPDVRASAIPVITDDIYLPTIRQVVNECATDPVQNTRKYFAYGPKKLVEVLAAEAQLLGAFWRLDYYGRIVLSKIEPPTSGAVPVAAIDSSTLIVSSGFGELELEAFGTLNTEVFRTGYKPDEDKYVDPPFVVRDASSFGLNKAKRAIEVKPLSFAEPSYERPGIAGPTFVRLAQTLLGMFGGPYHVATVDVSLRLFDVLCGDVVTFSHSRMPNESGTRGISARAALVIGRRWVPREGKGTLTLMYAASRFVGYTPTMRVTAASGATTSWTLTVDASTEVGSSSYLPTGTDATDFFQVGDAILLRQWDATSPTTRTGTVSAVTATTIGVTLGSAWAGLGGNVYMVGFDQAVNATAHEQAGFGYMGDTDLLAHFSTPAPAAVFSP